ncbi:MAG: M3 family oligoendopeptidase [Eubacteriales bacterium]
MPDFENLIYERPSLDAFRECVLRVRLRIMTAHTTSVVESALAEFQKELSRFETNSALCQIHHDLNTLDAFFLEELAFFEEAQAVVSELSSGLYSLLLSSTISEEIKERLGPMIFRKAQNRKDTISSEIVPDLADETALSNEYSQILSESSIVFGGSEYSLSMMEPFLESTDREVRKLAHLAVSEYFASQKDRFDKIFDRMVSLRTNMARKLSYPDFVSLGYKRMERYDYTPEMVENFRNFVVKYIVPVTVEIRRLQKVRLEVEDLKYYDLPNLFAAGNPKPAISADELPGAASLMFRKIFEKDPSFYDVLEVHGFTDLDARKAKSTGGYCETLLDYGIPFIFMNANGLADDVATLIHESGHAYAAIRSVGSSPFVECLSPTLETCEIHSTAMEYLAYPYLEYFFGNRADAYRQLHMTQSLLFLPYGCMVDEFQHCVYENPKLSSEERHTVWHMLENKYQPYLDYDGVDFYEKGGAWQKKGHIFTDPFYYIDYCLAQVVALQIWDMSRTNPQKALRVYDQLCMEGGNGTFLELLDKAGLSSPFSKDVLKRVAYRSCDYLNL